MEMIPPGKLESQGGVQKVKRFCRGVCLSSMGSRSLANSHKLSVLAFSTKRRRNRKEIEIETLGEGKNH